MQRTKLTVPYHEPELWGNPLTKDDLDFIFFAYNVYRFEGRPLSVEEVTGSFAARAGKDTPTRGALQRLIDCLQEPQHPWYKRQAKSVKGRENVLKEEVEQFFMKYLDAVPEAKRSAYIQQGLTQRFEIPPVRVPKWLMKEIERYKLPFIHTIANQCNNPDGSAMNIERRNEVVSRCFFNNTSPGNCKVVEILRQNEHELTKNVEKAIYSHTVVIDFVINRTQQVIFLCYKEKEAPRVPDADVSVLPPIEAGYGLLIGITQPPAPIQAVTEALDQMSLRPPAPPSFQGGYQTVGPDASPGGYDPYPGTTQRPALFQGGYQTVGPDASLGGYDPYPDTTQRPAPFQGGYQTVGPDASPGGYGLYPGTTQRPAPFQGGYQTVGLDASPGGYGLYPATTQHPALVQEQQADRKRPRGPDSQISSSRRSGKPRKKQSRVENKDDKGDEEVRVMSDDDEGPRAPTRLPFDPVRQRSE